MICKQATPLQNTAYKKRLKYQVRLDRQVKKGGCGAWNYKFICPAEKARPRKYWKEDYETGVIIKFLNTNGRMILHKEQWEHACHFCVHIVYI
jgi:hypothetical protein